jgi:predicted Zn-dependent protease
MTTKHTSRQNGGVPVSLATEHTSPPFPASRFLSAEECKALIQRVEQFAEGGGETTVYLNSGWIGNLRWARNHIISSGDLRDNSVLVVRNVNGASGRSSINALDDRHLRLVVRRAERIEEMQHEVAAPFRAGPPFIEGYLKPKIWFDSTYHQDAGERAALMERLVQPAAAAGVLAAGYLQVSAWGRSNMNKDRLWYYPYTQAEYSVTVRMPDGSGSGWAGVDWSDWDRVNAEKLSQIALDKCLRSRNPVRIEPGRYTTILEPQAVGDLAMRLFSPAYLSRLNAEIGDPFTTNDDPEFRKNFQSPFQEGPGISKLGQQVIDPRLSVHSDCMDPDLGYPPFDNNWIVYKPVTWIKNGVLTNLIYGRQYAVEKLGLNTNGIHLWGSGGVTGSFHMTVQSETASIEEMIATTKRGILVTRFWGIPINAIDERSVLYTGYTRDGLWLIENGKISRAIKNFKFTESPLFMLNNIEQIGTPQRIYNPGYPIVVPALKVRDFSFTSLSDAI